MAIKPEDAARLKMADRFHQRLENDRQASQEDDGRCHGNHDIDIRSYACRKCGITPELALRFGFQ